jgi:hypothetical protein
MGVKIMSKPIIQINDIATGEIIEREMNAAEFKQYEADQKLFAKMQADAEAKLAQRQAILDRLGLTADEAKLLLG